MVGAGMSGFHQVLQAGCLSPPNFQVRQQVVALQSTVSARLDGVRARLEEFSRLCHDLALFWSPSADDLRASFRSDSNKHLKRTRELRTELELTRQGVDNLCGRELPAALERLQALAAKVDDLRQVLEKRELFWKAEAEGRPVLVIEGGAHLRAKSALKRV